MKAIVIEQVVYEGIIAYAHGAGFKTRKLVIPEANNLTLAPKISEYDTENNKVYAYHWTDFDRDNLDNDVEFVKEVEVPDEMVQQGRILVDNQNALDAHAIYLNYLANDHRVTNLG